MSYAIDVLRVELQQATRSAKQVEEDTADARDAGARAEKELREAKDRMRELQVALDDLLHAEESRQQHGKVASE